MDLYRTHCLIYCLYFFGNFTLYLAKLFKAQTQIFLKYKSFSLIYYYFFPMDSDLFRRKSNFPYSFHSLQCLIFFFFCPSHLHSVRTSQLVLHITDVDSFYCFDVQILILKFYLESLIKLSQCRQLLFYFSC